MSKGSFLAQFFKSSFEKVTAVLSDEEFIEAENSIAATVGAAIVAADSASPVLAVVENEVIDGEMAATRAATTGAATTATAETNAFLATAIETAVNAAMATLRNETQAELTRLTAENNAYRAQETHAMAVAVSGSDVNPATRVVGGAVSGKRSFDEEMAALAAQFPLSMSGVKFNNPEAA